MVNIANVTTNFSKIVWEWMKIAQSIPSGNSQETGFTSYLLYLLKKEEWMKGISFYDSPNTILSFQNQPAEKISGADFLMHIRLDQVISLKLSVQAKRLKPYNTPSSKNSTNMLDCIYKEVPHKIGKEKIDTNSGKIIKPRRQINTLIRYARENKLQPYYLFYNSSFSNYFEDTTSFIDFQSYLNSSHTIDIEKIDRNYVNNDSQSLANLGTFFTRARDVARWMISKKQYIAPTFKNVLEMDSTTTLQEYFRILFDEDSKNTFNPNNPYGPNGPFDRNDPNDPYGPFGPLGPDTRSNPFNSKGSFGPNGINFPHLINYLDNENNMNTTKIINLLNKDGNFRKLKYNNLGKALELIVDFKELFLILNKYELKEEETKNSSFDFSTLSKELKNMQNNITLIDEFFDGKRIKDAIEFIEIQRHLQRQRSNSTNKPPSLADLTPDSKLLYENLSSEKKNYVMELMEINIDRLPMFFFDITIKDLQYSD